MLDEGPSRPVRLPTTICLPGLSCFTGMRYHVVESAHKERLLISIAELRARRCMMHQQDTYAFSTPSLSTAMGILPSRPC
jgi:hypothetical protein